jgi:hypothetical protein
MWLAGQKREEREEVELEQRVHLSSARISSSSSCSVQEVGQVLVERLDE